MGKLYVVGIGPGDLLHMTAEARAAIGAADVVVGYRNYLEQIASLIEGKKVVSSGMRAEMERCREALHHAAGDHTVALVSGGDAGIYGMAGLVLELLHGEANPLSGVTQENRIDSSPEVVVVPGVSAVQAAAAVLGAPLMNDFAVISLSDLLTPWEAIKERLRGAAATDFVVALYNPKSRGRTRQICEAREIFLRYRPITTPVGIVRNAMRTGEEVMVTTLGGMLNYQIDMFSLVIVGNSTTFVDGEGRMVTPRGYRGDSRGPVRGESRELPVWPESKPKAVMFCGTASDVGKSVITAGFCRILKRREIAVAPFKSQNMALNSAVTPDGGEIGRAQAVQADACGIAPHVDMNPILLKPTSDTGSQVIVHGEVMGNMSVAEYNRSKPELFNKVEESFARLAERFEFVVIEGAGSIAEINLKAHDIANLKVAAMAGAPVILVADIDRGGVFAQIAGTLELLEPEERKMVKGIIINKFRGDPALLTPGIEFIEQRCNVPVLGVIPWFAGISVPEEDSVALTRRSRRKVALVGKFLQVGVVRLEHISNYTDFDPLEAEPDVMLRYVEGRRDLEGLDLLIIPGSKSVTTDLFFLMEQGIYDGIKVFKGPIAGICGGFQMLGKRVCDPFHMESHIREAEGLGLLDVETTMLKRKETHQVQARLLLAGTRVAPGCSSVIGGYEIHMGETELGRDARPFATIVRRSGTAVKIKDGAVSPDGRVFGTYMHGLFDNDRFRAALLNRLRRSKGMQEVSGTWQRDEPLDRLADHLEKHLDMPRLLAICGLD
jgi:adenosylcobyric acid synthase